MEVIKITMVTLTMTDILQIWTFLSRVLTSVAAFAYTEVRIHATLKENMAKDV